MCRKFPPNSKTQIPVTQLLFNEESYKIIGACFEVYREKGCGFLEPVYQECMEIELVAFRSCPRSR